MKNRDDSLSIEDVEVFSQLLIYGKSRTIKSLNAHPILRRLEPKVKNRVVSSMLIPKRAVLELYSQVTNSSTINEIADHTLMLYQRILSEYDPQKILFVAVLRGGFQLAYLLRYVIYRMHNIDVEIVGITPNYINQIDASSFKDYIARSGRDVVFIDGWCSEGTTYTIVERFWYGLFPDKKFKYVVLSNLSPIENNDLVYATEEDILIPWSICQTDNLGISNYFLHPVSNRACAFLIPKNKRKIQDSGVFYRRVIDSKIKKKDYSRDIVKLRKRKKENKTFSHRERAGRLVKLGINECIKSIDKNDSVELYISDEITSFYGNILKEYASTYSVRFQITSSKNCFVVRNFSQ